MSWYKDWFGQDYLKVYPHRDAAEANAQIEFVTKTLPMQPKDRILDLGCGNGRHAQELSKRGFVVTCLDLSAVLLRLAKSHGDEGTGFVRADMRQIPFSDAFDYILSFFTTFGYFKTDAENLRTLGSIHTALKPGGTFLQDYLNKDYVINHLIPRDSRQQNGSEIVQERHYNRAEERIEKKITLRENGEARQYFESVRLYTLDEMKSLLAKAHLRLDQTFGDFNGSPFTTASPRLILIGSRE